MTCFRSASAPLLAALLAVSPALAASPRANADGDRKKGELLVELLLETRRFDEAEKFLAKRRASEPKEPLWLLLQARLASARGRPAEAVKLYRQLLDLAGESAQTLKEIGLESLFAGELESAGQALEKARRLAPKDGEIPGALSEIAYAQGRTRDGQALAREALSLLPADGGFEMEKRRLRLSARLQWDRRSDQAYEALFDKHPDDHDLLGDWIDALLDHGRLDRAREKIALFKERFPNQERSAAAHRFDYFARREDWDAAAEALRDWVARNPSDWLLRKDLGEAELRSGRWEDAERDLAGPAQLEEDPYLARPLLKEVREESGIRAGPVFRYRRFPGDTSLEEGAALRAPLRGRLRLEAEALNGNYKSADATRGNWVPSGTAKVFWRSSRIDLGADAGWAAGDYAARLSPGAFGRWRWRETRLEGSYERRRIFNEFAHAVAARTLEDGASAAAETRPFPWIYLQGNYKYNEYYAGDGARAQGREYNPAAGFILSQKPYFAVGYEGIIGDVRGDDRFFSQVPLLQRSRAHFAAVNLSFWRFRDALRADLRFVNGQDNGRGRHFGRAQMFGAGVGLDWAASSRIHAAAAYDYGKDSAVGTAGTFHSVRLQVQARIF